MPVLDDSSDSVWWLTLTEADRNLLSLADSQTLLPSPDLLVVGGGIIGLAAAYFAAEQGRRVQVISDNRIGTDAEASLGGISPNACGWQFDSAVQAIAQESRDWWARLAVRPEFQVDWRVSGALMIDPVRLAPDPSQHSQAALHAGFSLHAIDSEQLALLEPQLSPMPLGGLHYPSEAILHPLKAVCGFARGLRKRGGRITRIDADTDAEVQSGRCIAVTTSHGVIQARNVLLADPELMSDEVQIAESNRFATSRRVLLATDPVSPVLNRPVLDAHWMIQLKSGEVVLEVPMTDQPSKAVTAAVERTRQLLPSLRDVAFNKSWRGRSERSSNRQPALQKSDHAGNVWECRGFDFMEVLFAPYIGRKLVSELVASEPKP